MKQKDASCRKMIPEEVDKSDINERISRIKGDMTKRERERRNGKMA